MSSEFLGLLDSGEQFLVHWMTASTGSDCRTEFQHAGRWVSYPCRPKHAMRDWLGGRDSNPDTQIQSLQSYR
jgi:hypothetical protein